MNALISIRPQYVQRILAGEKCVEIRRRPCLLAVGTRLWIYSTKPVAKVEAVAHVAAVEAGDPREIWERVSTSVCLEFDDYANYLHGAELACAIHLHSVTELKPAPDLESIRSVSENFHPPQFFLRLHHRPDLLDFLERSLLAE